jgi:hypothetical protein
MYKVKQYRGLNWDNWTIRMDKIRRRPKVVQRGIQGRVVAGLHYIRTRTVYMADLLIT